MPGKTVHDEELKTMAVVADALSELPTDEAQARVLRYLFDRYAHVLAEQPPRRTLLGQMAADQQRDGRPVGAEP